MKKVTKFLSILLLVAMCMSLFGGSAYALELGGNNSSSAPTAGNDGGQLSGDAYLDGGSSGSTDLEISEEPTIGPILKAPVKPPVISGGEAEINGTQYETLEKALAAAKSGDTITFLKNVKSTKPVTISAEVTLDLSDNLWQINSGLTVNENVTITGDEGSGEIELDSVIAVNNSTLNNNSTLTIKNIKLNATAGFSTYRGKIEMKNVTAVDGDYNFFTGMTRDTLLVYSGYFKFNPAGFNAEGTVIEENSDLGVSAFNVKIGSAKYQASLNGTNYETLQAAFDAAEDRDTVYVLMQNGDNALSDAALNGSKSITLNLNNEIITKGDITVNAGSTMTIVNGQINSTVANYGTLTVSGSTEIATLRVKGGYVYNNGKITTMNIDDGSVYMSDSNAGIDTINVYNTPKLYISGGTVGSITENTKNAPKNVTGGTWGSENVSGYVADGYEAKQQVIGTWTVQAKGFVPVTPTPAPTTNPTTPPTPTGNPVNASITLDNGTRAYQYNQFGNTNPALRFTASPAANVTSVVAYTASGVQTLSRNDYDYDTNTGVITLRTSYVESIKAQTVSLYFYFSGETNPASATVYVVPYYSLNTSSYTRSSGSAVYFSLSTGSAYGYRYGTSTDFSKSIALPTSCYSESKSGSYTTLRLTNSFLDSLANGSYYFFYVLDNNNTRVCMNSGNNALRISGSGSPTPAPVPDDYMVDYISGIDSWYSGDEKLGFRVQPVIGKNGGIAVDGYKVPGEDYVDKGTGLIYLGINYLNNLATGWHTLTVYYDTMFQNPNRSIQFYVGPSLKPVDTDKHVINSSKDLKFVCSDTIDPKNVRVGSGNGWLEEGNQFTISGNGRYITLKAKFLNARTAGETYTLNVKTTSGEWTSCNFRILTTAQAASSPRTGDNSNIGLWLVFMAVSGGAVAVALPKLKKGKD